MDFLKISVDEYRKLQEKLQQLQSKADTKTETIVRLGKDLQFTQEENRLIKARSLTLDRNMERLELEVQKYAANELNIKANFKLEKKQLMDEVQSLRKDLAALLKEKEELKAEKIDLQNDCKLFRQRIAKYEVATLGGSNAIVHNDIGPNKKIVQDMGVDELERYEKLYKEVS
ncbi:unnamed protein product [Angiostrongylus costaricensis]|uniref:DUF4201 domain-containing protein n=1 Tax=Angiostrongylus costaricensis TaxID=334426 RepID=A0A0R3PI53_ANGCS|nr:unnamed protein product [Angiostrongylus costaricensis]